jgi:hypothetical protein
MKAFSQLVLTATLMISPFAKAECRDCTTLDFGKKIELKLIAPMLKMTLEEKAKYIQSFGVELFKVEDTESNPVTLNFLAPLPKGVFGANIIKKFSEGTLGIYMTHTNFIYGVKKPTILLIESADDWTLVHEFSHFLFDKARIMQDSTRESTLLNRSEDAQEDYFDAMNSYKVLDMYRSEEHKKHTVDSFIVYANTQMIFAETCEFEETTIEKMIRALYVHHSPQGFEEPDFERSTRYIRETSTNGQHNLNLLTSSCEDIYKTLTEADGELKKSLDEVCTKIEKLKQADLDVLKGLGLELNKTE